MGVIVEVQEDLSFSGRILLSVGSEQCDLISVFLSQNVLFLENIFKETELMIFLCFI